MRSNFDLNPFSDRAGGEIDLSRKDQLVYRFYRGWKSGLRLHIGDRKSDHFENFDKLDQERVRQIVQILENKDFGQIFITDTHIERVKDALSGLKNKEEIFDLKEIYSNG